MEEYKKRLQHIRVISHFHAFVMIGLLSLIVIFVESIIISMTLIVLVFIFGDWVESKFDKQIDEVVDDIQARINEK